MWTQIIFFIAVALLVIILLRHAAVAARSSKSETAEGRRRGLTATLSSLWRSVSSFYASLIARLSTLLAKRSSVGLMAQSDRRVDNVNQNNHSFWKEEAIQEKYELSSHFEEGEALYKAGKLDEAEQFFVKSAANNPSDPKVYARLGLLYLQTKNYSDAIEALKVAVKLDKYNPSRHYNLALAYYGNKDGQKAIAAVREAITLDPVTQKYRALLEQLLNG